MLFPNSPSRGIKAAANPRLFQSFKFSAQMCQCRRYVTYVCKLIMQQYAKKIAQHMQMIYAENMHKTVVPECINMPVLKKKFSTLQVSEHANNMQNMQASIIISKHIVDTINKLLTSLMSAR